MDQKQPKKRQQTSAAIRLIKAIQEARQREAEEKAKGEKPKIDNRTQMWNKTQGVLRFTE